jgi:hypothetical protein
MMSASHDPIDEEEEPDVHYAELTRRAVTELKEKAVFEAVGIEEALDEVEEGLDGLEANLAAALGRVSTNVHRHHHEFAAGDAAVFIDAVRRRLLANELVADRNHALLRLSRKFVLAAPWYTEMVIKEANKWHSKLDDIDTALAVVELSPSIGPFTPPGPVRFSASERTTIDRMLGGVVFPKIRRWTDHITGMNTEGVSEDAIAAASLSLLEHIVDKDRAEHDDISDDLVRRQRDLDAELAAFVALVTFDGDAAPPGDFEALIGTLDERIAHIKAVSRTNHVVLYYCRSFIRWAPAYADVVMDKAKVWRHNIENLQTAIREASAVFRGLELRGLDEMLPEGQSHPFVFSRRVYERLAVLVYESNARCDATFPSYAEFLLRES